MFFSLLYLLHYTLFHISEMERIFLVCYEVALSALQCELTNNSENN